MKKNYVTEAINLKSYPLNDNDSIVVMFSKSRGLISAVAKGVKRPKSKLGARAQMFIANRLLMSEGKNLDTIGEAQSLNTFSKIRSNLDKLSYSMYLAECVNNFCSNNYNKDENPEEIYKLIYSAYEKMAGSNTKEEILLCVLKFQLKLLNILGWGIDFNTCGHCQKKLDENSYFSFSINSFLCDSCYKNETGEALRIHNKIRLFLNELSICDFSVKTMYDDVVNMIVLEKCFNFMKKYMDNLTHKRTKIFKTLEAGISI